MNPYLAYQKKDLGTGWTRIDLLLALYDKALTRLDTAEAALRAWDRLKATTQLVKTQLILQALASGVKLEVNEKQGTNMLLLYEFVANELRTPRLEGIANARKILRTLREGFESIRAEANELERSGRIPPADRPQMVLVTA